MLTARQQADDEMQEAFERQRPMLTAREAAKILRLSVNTLANWRMNKKGPKYIKFSNKGIRYFVEDIYIWLDQNSNGAS